MKNAGDSFEVRRGVDPSYLQSILTKDITPLESIYDLIDNAIDAARDRMFEHATPEVDKFGLPKSYAGAKISIRFSVDAVSFLDNCSGISEETLSSHAFITGHLSQHRFGIGRFGIGLNRALFRLGTNYILTTDVGTFAARMRFADSDLGSSGASTLIAERVPSRGRHKTFIRVTGLRDGVRHEFESPSWRETIIKSLARRYGIYIAKGFSISVNGEPVHSFGPSIRDDGPVNAQSENIITTEGVRVFIDAGMHEGYRLRHESDWDINDITPLTDQYGWYFVCNDRIIKIANHDPDLGWTTTWHNEYYGFVGWVRFVADDVGHLPWDTKKSTIDPNSSVFRQIAGSLQPFAERYRTDNRKARDRQPPNGSGRQPTGGSGRDKVRAQTDRGLSGTSAADHNENWSTLLPKTDITITNPKVRALIYEAEHLPIETCYCGAMLLRSIIELSLGEHLKLTGHFKAVRQWVFDEQEKAGRAFTPEQKKAFRPTFSNMLDWLGRTVDYFPIEVCRECVAARNKFDKHLGELNGVVHEGNLIDSGKLKIIRNDTLPLLRFLLITNAQGDD